MKNIYVACTSLLNITKNVHHINQLVVDFIALTKSSHETERREKSDKINQHTTINLLTFMSVYDTCNINDTHK